MSFVLPWRPWGRTLSAPLVAGWAVGLLTLALYLYTLAPSVTLEDSGEYITAAATLGVTHPPGYPLWTTISHLFIALVPFGNVAWRVNLVSAVFGGIANGLVAALAAHSTRWLLDGRAENDVHAGLPGWLLPLLAGLAAGLSLGCSDVMWSQSVIVEVYTLNVTFLLATLWFLYLWSREPQRTGHLLAAGAVYALGLTNHNSLLFISPVFPLLVWMVRRDFFPSFMSAVFLFSLSAGAVLVWFSDDPLLQEIIRRLAFVLLAVVGGFAVWKRAGRWRGFAAGFLLGAAVCLAASFWVGAWFHIESATGWLVAGATALAGGLIGQSALDRRFILAFLVLGWAGLMPYGLESFYSSTNPPMNWSYARTKAGFFYAVSRGQYTNNLSGLLEKTFGPPLGVFRSPEAPAPEGAPAAAKASPLERAVRFANGCYDAVRYYVDYLQSDFSVPLCLIAFLSIFIFGNLPRERRNWLLFLAAAFVMLSFFLTLIDPPDAVDRATHAIRRRFYLQAHCVFAIALGYGVAGGLLALRRHAREVPIWAYGLVPLLAAFPFALNYATSEQRGHWFGWQYGTDMLRPLDKDAVVFGGTDPGRFVPTYMIFCESRQPARWKRDPSFDRSDLYVLTQNALGDYFYMRYLYDQYDVAKRIAKYTPFEKWLGRDTAYPAEGIVLPTEEEFGAVFQKVAADSGAPQGGATSLSGLDSVFKLNGEMARIIFERNKAKHSFYIEESFPIPWMYPYLAPAGLIMKINPEPLAAIPAETARQDRAFWDAYAAKLLADPRFLADQTARSAFGKLRLSIAGLYAFRRMDEEALYAFRQALALAPHNPEAIIRMTTFLFAINRAEEAAPELEAALAYDPENKQLQQMAFQLQFWKELQGQVKLLRAALAANPADLDASRKLVKALLILKQPDEAVSLLEKRAAPISQEELTGCLQALQGMGAPALAARLLDGQLRLRPADPILLYQRATFYALEHRPADAYRLLGQAIAAGGDPFRAAPASDASWDPYRNDPAFQAVVAAKAPQAPAPAPAKGAAGGRK